jgi:hypothetical protein
MTDDSDSPKQFVIMKQLRGTSVSVGIVASYLADKVYHADTYFF